MVLWKLEVNVQEILDAFDGHHIMGMLSLVALISRLSFISILLRVFAFPRKQYTPKEVH